jgi:hypothetical protein
MFEVASSRHMISLFKSTILKKLRTYFSPFERFAPFYEITKSALQVLVLELLMPRN